jgi:hypothetical protein
MFTTTTTSIIIITTITIITLIQTVNNSQYYCTAKNRHHATQHLRQVKPAVNVSLPSVGSILHGTGTCKPCAWFWKPQERGRGGDELIFGGVECCWLVVC